MKAAILGGTFNPPHWAHLFLAEEVRVSLGYDAVIFLPANLPAHKEVGGSVRAEDRWEMLKAALGDWPYFKADSSEIERGGITYTVETVPALVAKYGIQGKPGFILGDDLMEGFANWREAERLAGMVDLIVAHRQHAGRKPFAFEHRYIDNILLPVSSTDIRRRIRQEEAVRFLMPERVWRYITDHALYRS
jgi:nicotinate-nucleotide adenylyltransferase